MRIYRHIEKELLRWKNSKERKPLILRGARQVGGIGDTHYDEKKAKSFFFVPVSANETTGLSKESLISTL